MSQDGEMSPASDEGGAPLLMQHRGKWEEDADVGEAGSAGQGALLLTLRSVWTLPCKQEESRRGAGPEHSVLRSASGQSRQQGEI